MSFTNASTSAGVGGSPVRSKVSRRMSVRRSAGAAGLRLFASSFARINRSTGVMHHVPFFTAGNAGRRTGWNDQCELREADVSHFAGFALWPSSGAA